MQSLVQTLSTLPQVIGPINLCTQDYKHHCIYLLITPENKYHVISCSNLDQTLHITQLAILVPSPCGMTWRRVKRVLSLDYCNFIAGCCNLNCIPQISCDNVNNLQCNPCRGIVQGQSNADIMYTFTWKLKVPRIGTPIKKTTQVKNVVTPILIYVQYNLNYNSLYVSVLLEVLVVQVICCAQTSSTFPKSHITQDPTPLINRGMQIHRLAQVLKQCPLSADLYMNLVTH